MNLSESMTLRNLMRAFAGESQARNRYTFAAGQARSQKLPVLERLFEYTAGQEKEHAEIFFNHIKTAGVDNVAIDASYPVDPAGDILPLLKAAHHNELEEFESAYPAFAKTAREEGFSLIAESFERIAAVEKIHGERFARFARLLESGELFSAPGVVNWLCLNCGHIHSGKEAPVVCPVCVHERGYFIRMEDSPFH